MTKDLLEISYRFQYCDSIAYKTYQLLLSQDLNVEHVFRDEVLHIVFPLFHEVFVRSIIT